LEYKKSINQTNTKEKLTMEIYSALHDIQNKLVCQKNQFNAFGKYKYRSCEDILTSVKQLVPTGYIVTLTDEITQLSDRFYVKSTAQFSNGKESVSCIGFAREELTKKGQDGAQVTGAASSYARKYALNGLFCIDDTKDADHTNDGKTSSAKITADQVALIEALIEEVKADKVKFLAFLKVPNVESILSTEYKKAIAALECKRS